MSFHGNPPTFCLKTLGCKVNQYETELMRECLKQSGFVEENDEARAHFCIINSCTVTQTADKETRNLARHFYRINPSGKVVITGCYAEFEEDRKVLKGLSGVTHLVRNCDKTNIAQILLPNACSLQPRTCRTISNFKNRDRAFIKIQDGCDHKCSYCKVGLVRGPSRSRKIEDILSEAEGLVNNGFREIVLTGVCLGAWGLDLEKKKNLASLVEEILAIEGDFRIRLSSIEPAYVTERLTDLMKNNPKICKHLHVPLQSGDDKVLALMRRRYTIRRFFDIIKRARKKIPDLAFTTDILAGFPGEGEANFKSTLKFIQRIKPSRVHIFSYSKRQFTPAAGFKSEVEKSRKNERAKALIELGHIFAKQFVKSFIGKKELVLVESRRDTTSGLLTGYTDRYVRVLFEGPDSLRGKLASIVIKSVDESKNSVLAKLL
ncbi:MAG: tRNA (N(6)-L-threonylcarbamoyladenosine(37)-C(2))-methylthiotransferase MtaB [Candidatus Omnitrophica bacterium]|nr:tRNA (N(6)-L-threonylcarbamoyladenosine(37)-C(2))-methylthiotransferase MtaB [Candidatus Omnitrophota bacterium]